MNVYVLIPNVCVKKIKLNPSLPFSTFQRLFPFNDKRRFIYNGQVIDEKQSLIQIGIKDNESFVALPYEKDEYSPNTISWMRITGDSDFFNEKVQDYIKMDPMEFAKVKDRVQNNRKNNPINNLLYLHENNKPFDTSFSKDKEPNNSSLPLF